MKYYIIAGEASGDLHGSNLIKEIHQKDPEAIIRCWGGDLMEAQGAQLVKHYKELAFMGFTEVIKNLPTIMRNFSFCKKDIGQFKPNAIIFIDYPGFNLRMAKWAKNQGIKTIYYISPQVWAWKESRVNDIKKYVDHMLVILPFEKDFYRKWNYEVTYVGHPLVDVIEEKMKKGSEKEIEESDKIIALLPGSRKQEILVKLPIMLEASRNFPQLKFTVAMAPGIDKDFYDIMLADYPNVIAVSGSTYDILLNAKAAFVTSGTATLETALFNVPQVVCYKGSKISYLIAKQLIKVKYISLVNLIMDKEVIKELIQDALTPDNLTVELNKILNDQMESERIKSDYSELRHLLKKGGNASDNAAGLIVRHTMGF